MRKILTTIVSGAALICAAYGANGYYGLRDASECDGVVDVTLADVAASGGYETLTLPTGFKMFNLIRVYPLSPGAAQWIKLRFWTQTSASDSVIADTVRVHWATTVYGEAYAHYFPVRCKKVSILNVDATDDFKVEGYCSRR